MNDELVSITEKLLELELLADDTTEGWTDDAEKTYMELCAEWAQAYYEQTGGIAYWTIDGQDVLDSLMSDTNKEQECEDDADYASLSKPQFSPSTFGSGLYKPSMQYHSNAHQCNHHQEDFALIEGVPHLKVWCSGTKYVGHNVQQSIPDFGLYLDQSWANYTNSRNEFVNWPDFKTPVFTDVAYTQINDLFERISDGETCEIGCIGAHGRTGTLLACLVLLAHDGEMSAREAIDDVRDRYCDDAVETSKQEMWVGDFAVAHWGHDPLTVKTHSIAQGDMCTPSEHFAMINAGATGCQRKVDCRYWLEDLIAYKS